MDLLPNALGPHSIPPWNQPITPPLIISLTTNSIKLLRFLYSIASNSSLVKMELLSKTTLMSSFENEGPIDALTNVYFFGSFFLFFITSYAAPIAPPESPAAGGINIF